MPYQEIIETQKRIIDTISKNSKEALIITDPNTLVTHFNTPAENLTGYHNVEVIGKPLDDFLVVKDENGQISSASYCPTSEIDLHGIVYDGKEVKIISKNLEEKIVNFRTVKVKGGKEVNIGCLIFIENTFQKSEFERMKMDFVAMAEHILRTPVTIVKSYLSRLNSEKTLQKLDEIEVNYLSNSISTTNDMLALVEDLFNLSKIQQNELKLNRANFDIIGVLSKFSNQYKIVASQKNLSVTFVPPIYMLPMVNADILKVKMVIGNLLENAYKYTNTGGITLTIEKQDDSYLKVGIKDTGKGISDKNLPYLFTKFYRVKNALEMSDGLGIGLFLCKAVIEAHSGKIWVETQEGKGSIFYFTLPIAK